MNIRITRLELTNFKCFKSKEFKFDSHITTIRGRNGAGKTTIADAILWCLFGKNAAGQSSFSIKTHDEHGNDIPHLDHSVEIVLETSDPNDATFEITLKRTLKETWIKKRRTSEQVLKNNTTEYLINGEAVTAKDYEKYISELIPEEIFRAITNPLHFLSLKWQVQREFLAKMVGDIDNNDIVGDFEELKSLSTEESKDIIAYLKHLSYQINQVKDKLDKVPVRLEEQHKALPVLLDWDKLASEQQEIQIKLQSLNDEIVRIKSGNGGDVLREQINGEIVRNLQDIADYTSKVNSLIIEEQRKKDENVAEASRKFNSLVTTQRDLESQIKSFDTLILRCNDVLSQCEKDAQQIREEWAANLSRKLAFSDNDCICPTCGQYLPQDQVAEKRKKAETDLLKSIADTKQSLIDRANKTKKLRSDTEDEIKNLENRKTESEKALEETKSAINDVFSEKAKLEKVRVRTFEERTSDDDKYQSLLKEKEDLKKKMDSVGVDTDSLRQLVDLENKKKEYTDSLRQLTEQLATKSQYEKIQALIGGIEKEQKDLIEQISDLERREDIARQYQDRQNEILEERINQHFSLVRWKMFRTINNGGDSFQEPYCECYSPDGSAYHDGANKAMRLNMGLDIINTLCKHYGVSAPIILDNAESTINILDTIGQQIRLSVNDSDLQTI